MPVELTRVLAPNPGPMTLEGTNTWVLRGAGGTVVIDPGPLEESHLAAVARLGPVDLVLITHRHSDHSAGADRLSALTGAPVRRDFVDGEQVIAGEVRLGVLATPGHSSDSVCFLAEDRAELFTGDTVLGRGTTVVAYPDGRLADYLESLERIAALRLRTILPGHGPQVADPAGCVAFYREHRADRLRQVARARDAGARTPREVVESVYADVDRALWPAAEQSVRAQLDYLATRAAPL
ncbi:MAG: MBL fold metallo-hydrolase [Mycobacteriales bacterium]